MLDFLPVSLPYFMTHALIALTAAKEDENVMLLLADFNYTEAVLDEGLLAHANIVALDETQKSLHEKQYKFGRKFRKHMKQAKDAFTTYKKLTDLAFSGETHELTKLCKTAKRSSKIFQWLRNARTFYNTAIAEIESTESDDVLQRFAKYGVTKEKLEAALEKVIQAEGAKINHVTLKGEAEEKIRERDAEARVFHKWMRDYIDVAKIAFADKPQYIEKLAISKLSDGYKRKVKDEVEAEEEPPEEPSQAGT